MTAHRDATTGQYVTAEHAKTNPDTTVSESPCAECERLRGVVHTQGVALDGYHEEVERLRAEPIVRTVGDLTARHIGKRVRVEGCEYTLDHIGPSKCLFILGPGGYFPGQQFPLDTPCEVL